MHRLWPHRVEWNDKYADGLGRIREAVFVAKLEHYSSVCLEEQNKTTTIYVRVAGLLTERRNSDLAHTKQEYKPFGLDVRYSLLIILVILYVAPT
jgi:hypothetical protein